MVHSIFCCYVANSPQSPIISVALTCHSSQQRSLSLLLIHPWGTHMLQYCYVATHAASVALACYRYIPDRNKVLTLSLSYIKCAGLDIGLLGLRACWVPCGEETC